MILVTGGAGYNGSHTCMSLITVEFEVVAFDNYSKERIKRVEAVVNKRIPIKEGAIRNKSDLQNIFDAYMIDMVIRFSGLQAVGESIWHLLKYYDNNISDTLILCEVIKQNNCKSIIFSLSATVYGDPYTVAIKEDFPLSATNPYGRSKLIIEETLRNLYVSDATWKIVSLSYFNPVGVHESSMIDEDSSGMTNSLVLFITQTVVEKRKVLNIFGDDYDTDDDTAVSDYMYVVDLAIGHVKVLEKLHDFTEVMTINLGAGRGYSLLEMVKAFEKVSGNKVPYAIVPIRSGDIAKCYADTGYVKNVLDWEAKKNIDEMCRHSWRWHFSNSNLCRG